MATKDCDVARSRSQAVTEVLCFKTALDGLKTLHFRACAFCTGRYSASKSPRVHITVCRSVLLYFNCFFLPGQLLGATISLDKMAVLCLFLMPVPALQQERHRAEPAGRLWPPQPYSSKVPCAARVPFSASTSCKKVCLTGVIITT